MNSTLTSMILLVFLTFIGGCAPLQQAPLVYSSKTAVGLDVSTNTTENPGFSFNIGVKLVDAAYVPVAVSKSIDQNATNKITPAILKLEAQYGQGNNEKNKDDLTEENKSKITSYLNAKAELSQAEIDVAKAESSKQDLTRILGKIDAVLGAVQAAKIVPDSQAENRERQVEYINSTMVKDLANSDVIIPSIVKDASGKSDFSEIEKRLISEKNTISPKLEAVKVEVLRLTATRESKTTAAQRLLSEAAKAASLLTTSKTDAFSVYGRFDSNGNANGDAQPTAQLLVGKVFSTGLASQNLTEAVKIEAQSKCVDRIVTAALSMQSAEKNALLQKIDKICPVATSGK